jgi:acetylornithine deacetylase/succinyl-diaminopimelate desuccinylase-like protein
VSAISYAQSHRDQFLEQLKTFVAIPSISTLPQHREDIQRAATWLLGQLQELGLSAEVVPIEGGHPLVYGEWLKAPGKPTVLFYGHYDVQPVDPLDEWRHPPFEPTMVGDDLFARGASDDKGQLFGILKALESLVRSDGQLPINIKILIEGEEEIGSPATSRWMDRHARKVACDFAWVSDGTLFAPGLPTLEIGLRGLLYTEVEVRGATRDLHSGLYGGAAPNPLNALASIIAGLKDKRGRVTVPRFYASVRDPSAEEKMSWERLPFREDDYLKDLGIPVAPGEEGYGILERRWTRPTLDVHGIVGGWIGAGSKTVIPGTAVAKISMRLVPDQKAKTIFRAFEKKVKALAPAGVEVQVRQLAAADPVLVDPSTPVIQTASKVLQQVWGTAPVYVREGGSVPIVAKFDQVLKVPTVMFVFGPTDSRQHAPNEKFHIPDFHRGIETIITFLQQVAK